MAFTLSNVLQRAYRELGVLTISTATDTPTTTIIYDSKLNDVYKDDEFKGGTGFIVKDVAGAAAAPEGEFGYITSSTGSTFDITLAAALTAAPVATDTYAFADSVFPLYMMIELTNDALRDLGMIPLVDTTTLDSAASQTEYTCQAVWKHDNGPIRIDLQTKTSDANDNQWREMPRDMWEYIPATAGSTGLIVSRDQLVSGRDIRVWYNDDHPRVDVYSSTIWEGFDQSTVVTSLVNRALAWFNAMDEGATPYKVQQRNETVADLQVKKLENPTRRPRKKPRLFLVGGGAPPEDKFTYPDPA